MKKCENCNKEHDGNYGSGRFCGKKCARSFSTKKIDKNKTKYGKCKICNKLIEINIRASSDNCKCDNCKQSIQCKQCKQIPCKRPDICKHYQIFPTLIKYFGFNKEVIGTLHLYEEYSRIQDLVMKEYWENKLSIDEMMKKFNYLPKNHRNFSKILESLNIKRRTLSNANKNAILQGRSKLPNNYIYKYGWHTTWDKNKIFYRSSYELEFAQKLDKQKIHYEVEKLKILYWDSQLHKQRIAIPDFYLPDSNEIIEVKSLWTYDEINMNDKVKTYKNHGYKFKLWLDKKFVDIQDGV
jgi:hypothetical protein